ncbi:PDZ domain-containing protein [Mucilaginibacter sp. KACC 22773]|uniref:M61 family metallopeptidase n=1 Tax=Mucilaginibacter sp. KACC 22773 TaxID=3025671 RepID=UPI00236510B8|nr:PDZ domain-containing protein [Mucilaginibacter sp. KACC 22773]WDF80397.1 PDZ domain-containing protein [Mucilaginibacter sp. KACC 22773]
MKILSRLLFTAILFLSANSFAQQQPLNMQYAVSMEKAADHLYHVELTNKTPGKTLDFKMCAWTPGYYQLIDFAAAVQNFKVTDSKGVNLKWQKASENTWRVYHNSSGTIKISYDVKATVPFVGNIYLDETRGYITPGGLFMYLDNELWHPVTIKMQPYSKWNAMVATGLDTVAGKYHLYKADNFDVLYDSPFLMGELEVLPPFTVKNKPHNFIGYKLPEFDGQAFMDDLKKIVVAGSNIIGEIPYTHYTFLSIGAGGGGIEHLNSSSLSFSGGEGFNSPEAKKRLYNFIAHEYFHHYNVKRIRPVELGPFDYSKENHTNMLWVSEGFTVYYEYMITRRAGLMTGEDMLKDFEENIKNYENKPGHFYQSATQASYNTWNDGPNGRVNEDINKTISYYDKGPVLGLMLDFNIRHATQNKKTLDDVMRLLYYKYYKKLNRGFTEKEFRAECEKMAGTPMPEVFEYASTVKPPDYPKYFAYGGLRIDTNATVTYNSWAGINYRQRRDTLTIGTVEPNSPAWEKGIRGGTKILTVEGQPATQKLLDHALEAKNTGDALTLTIQKGTEKRDVTIILGSKKEKTFKISPLPNPDPLQAAIYKSWIGSL